MMEGRGEPRASQVKVIGSEGLTIAEGGVMVTEGDSGERGDGGRVDKYIMVVCVCAGLVCACVKTIYSKLRFLVA